MRRSPGPIFCHTTTTIPCAVMSMSEEMGKTPVVVKDVAGFLVNRILGPYLDEAVRMFASGVEVERVVRELVLVAEAHIWPICLRPFSVS